MSLTACLDNRARPTKRKPNPEPERYGMKVRSLVILSNPKDTIRLSLEQELRQIQRRILIGRFRDSLELIPLLAPTTDDILHFLNQHKPQIVHFSGHGLESGELIVVDEAENAHIIPFDALVALFHLFRASVDLVILNACYSAIQAQVLAQSINYVIGMSNAVPDETAIAFAAAFYGALAFGKLHEDAFEEAKVSVQLKGLAGYDEIRLFVREKQPAQRDIPEAGLEMPIHSDTHMPRVTKSNPFVVGGIVPLEMFYGRRNAIRHIEERVSGHVLQSVSIVGQKRIGRSSLLHLFATRPQANRNHVSFFVYLDLMKGYCHTKNGLMQLLRQKLTKLWREPWKVEHDGDLSAFDYAVDELRSTGIRLILCLDGMEHLIQRGNEFDQVLEDWRACGQQGQIGLITTSISPLADLCQQHSLTSPFYNIFTQEVIGLLTSDEWQTLVTDHMDATDEELSLIAYVAGGHPFYTQLAASLLWQDKQEGVTEQHVTLSKIRYEFQPHFDRLWSGLSDGDRSVVTQLTFGRKQIDLPNEVLFDLSRRGMIAGDQPFSRLFADWLLSMH